jgi:hypothetical protein
MSRQNKQRKTILLRKEVTHQHQTGKKVSRTKKLTSIKKGINKVVVIKGVCTRVAINSRQAVSNTD